MKIKKILAALCLIVCLCSLTACSSSTQSQDFPSGIDESTVNQVTTSLFDSFCQMSEEDMEYLSEADNSEVASDTDMALAIKTALSSWLSAADDMGAYVSTDSVGAVFDVENIVGTLTATFENRPVEFQVTYDRQLSSYESIQINPEYSMGEKLARAGMNTVMGMGITFLVLILIAFCISLFKYIHKAEDYFAAKKAQKEEQVPFEPKSPEAAPVVYETETVDDLELVAVITAAVAASMNTSVDKLVVRSIKRRKTNRWS